MNLVDRIGGPERMRQILGRFYARLAGDPIVGFFFAGRDLESIADGQHRFLMGAMGAGPKGGKHPSEAHTDLPPILPGHFARRLVVLREVLEEEGLDPDNIEAWVKIEASFRGLLQGSHPF